MKTPFSSPNPTRSSIAIVDQQHIRLTSVVMVRTPHRYGTDRSGRCISGKIGLRMLWISTTSVLEPSSKRGTIPHRYPNMASTRILNPAFLMPSISTSFSIGLCNGWLHQKERSLPHRKQIYKSFFLIWLGASGINASISSKPCGRCATMLVTNLETIVDRWIMRSGDIHRTNSFLVNNCI